MKPGKILLPRAALESDNAGATDLALGVIHLKVPNRGAGFRRMPASGVELAMYCSETRWNGLSTNTSPVPSSPTSPETSRTGPSGVSFGISTSFLIRF